MLRTVALLPFLMLLVACSVAPAAMPSPTPVPPAATPPATITATSAPTRPLPTPRPTVDLQATAVAIGNATMAARPPAQLDAATAWRICTAAITAQLKAPATAVYPAETTAETTRLPQDGSLRMRSYVDAQNGYGALIRSTWACRVRLAPAGTAEVVYAALD